MSDLCNHDLLETWAEGRCTPDESAQLEAHIVECRTCTDERDWLRREHALFSAHAVSDTRSTDGLWPHVLAELAVPAVAAPVKHRSYAWVGGAAAAAVALLLLVKVGPMQAPHHTVTGAMSPGAALPTSHAHSSESANRKWVYTPTDATTIDVDGVDGSIDVTTGEVATVLLDATFDALPSGWHVEGTQAGDKISFRSYCERSHCGDTPEVKLAVVLPRKSLPVHVSAISAEVNVTDVLGDVAVSAISGDVLLQTRHVTRVTTVSGDINVSGTTGTKTLDLKTTSGDLQWGGECSDGCNVSVTTVSGDVQLTTGKTSAYHARIRTVSGDISFSARSGENATDTDHRLEVTIGRGTGKVGVTTVSGDVHLDADPPR